ncbi:MAG TPA: S8 family serine peptidase [Pyrinomonadaceae bacterium]|nr:S8 family serine peptidase [Pyrinomonadaceae bacterium]
MKKAIIAITMLILAVTLQPTGTATGTAVKVDGVLKKYFQLHPLATTPVVITYRQKPGSAEFARLQSVGIMKGFATQSLPMVIADMNALQLSKVSQQPGVRSIYANRVMETFADPARQFIGVPQMRADGEVTARNTQNPGFPISGKDIGIGYVDTGIDGTHEDLKFGTKTVQNVSQPLAMGVVSDGGLLLGVGVSISDLIAGTGFVPPIYVENLPMTDAESGHGTFGAGVAAGTGVQSGDFYGGVAKGAKLIGVQSGDDLGLPLVAIIGAFDYLVANQTRYNIRVVNNSWGSSLDADAIDPNNPINVATRIMHDLNMVVVFAAGNAGDTPTSINPYSTMPWTISVAAGEKHGLGSPAGFSSRGVNNGDGADVAGQPADETLKPNLRPDITGAGVDIKSTRSKGPGVVSVAGTVPLLGNDATTIAPAFLPFYTTSQGTSFACPQVSGVIALMLEANPLLTPDEVVTILRQTANPMPFEERVVGAGYVDAHNAVRAALGLGAVPHPANLFPVAGGPEIVDLTGDHFGSDAQDIRLADFSYDAANRQLVYTIELVNLAATTPNMRWALTSRFGETDIFVTASVDETATTYEYGRITTLPTGTRNQETIGAADSGQIAGNRIIIRVSIDKVNAAVGSDVLGATSTGTQAQSQVLIGTSVTGGLLLNSDSASGSDFVVQ